MNEKAMNLDTSAHKHEPAMNDDSKCASIVYDKKRGLWHQVNDELDSSQSSFKLKGNIDVGYQETQESGEWSTKLLHCGKDCDICCLVSAYFQILKHELRTNTHFAFLFYLCSGLLVSLHPVWAKRGGNHRWRRLRALLHCFLVRKSHAGPPELSVPTTDLR